MKFSKSIAILSFCFSLICSFSAQAGYIDNLDGTVTDTGTGLMWQQATAPGTYSWIQAIVYCESLNLATHTDWRLPTAQELETLTDKSRYNPAINTTYFPDTVAGFYWSSTTFASSSYYAWLLEFYDGQDGGGVYAYGKAGSSHVRAVRLGQSGAFNNLTLWPVPDTGQTQSYTSTFGEDSDYTINQPFYTKLTTSCTPLPDNATTWAMVRDDVTGLVWEEKNAKDNVINYADPNDADNMYTWYDSNPATNGGYEGMQRDGTDTEDFINALNTANYGGYSDWRMPNEKELQSIVNYGQYNAAINTTYFPDTVAGIYWSSTTCAEKTFRAWYVDFHYGSIYYDNKAAFSAYVRAVRGPDTDGDGIGNKTDNCPNVFNPQQFDANGNGIGDCCDPTPGCGGCGQPACDKHCGMDSDGDGIYDIFDNCPNVYNPQQLDANKNGVGDCCDPSPGCGGCGQVACDKQCTQP
jgi:hypothetical protein